MDASHTPFVAGRLAFVESCLTAAAAQPASDGFPGAGREVKMFKLGDDQILVHKINIDGVTPDDYRAFTDNYLTFVLELTVADRNMVNFTEVEKDANQKSVIH